MAGEPGIGPCCGTSCSWHGSFTNVVGCAKSRENALDVSGKNVMAASVRVAILVVQCIAWPCAVAMHSVVQEMKANILTCECYESYSSPMFGHTPNMYWLHR